MTNGVFLPYEKTHAGTTPRDKHVEDGVRMFRGGKHDGVVAFGGGSALDTGKTIGFMARIRRAYCGITTSSTDIGIAPIHPRWRLSGPDWLVHRETPPPPSRGASRFAWVYSTAPGYGVAHGIPRTTIGIKVLEIVTRRDEVRPDPRKSPMQKLGA
ncbi:iron-containing alcohol dehydrogenase [Mesorhizobium sp. M0217]|uniref:iron-containing alcohol dehydrogenase n=1 Tax=unclassified Mesorhizobium TaxID=325217 RepID=UPI00333C1242